MTWEEFSTKYPNGKRGLRETEKQEYLDDCFAVYEEIGFSDAFSQPYGDLKNRDGSAFVVVRRCDPAEGIMSQDALPAWEIMFADGFTVTAFPDEICVRQ